MSSTVKKVAPILAFGPLEGSLISKAINKPKGGGAAGPNPFDIASEAAKAEMRTEDQLTGALSDQASVDAARRGTIAQLGLSAAGKGPSLAQAQLKAAQERNLSQLIAQQASARGQGGGAAARNMAVAGAMGNRQTAQDSAQAMLQEATQARQQLFQEKEYADESARGRVDRAYDYAVAPKDKMQQYQMHREQIDAQKYAARKAAQAQMASAVIGGVSSGAMAMSDKEQKEDVKPASKKMEKFLSALNSKSYQYKDTSIPGTSEGDKFGIIAQDLEKSEVGASLVKDTPNGKMVDVNQTIMAVLAAQSDLNKRLKSMEKKKKK